MKFYYFIYSKFIHSYHYRFRRNKNRLKDKLIKNNQTRWLDIGCSISSTEGFFYLDYIDPLELPEEMREKYTQLDMTLPVTDDIISELGKFDFIRLQHVYEHFTPEKGEIVLNNIFKLLNDKGMVLITVPDLKKFISRYKRKSLRHHWSFSDWATTRIEKNAPESFYFSIFTHSVPHQAHHWCYDYDGLVYQINKLNLDLKIQKLGVLSKLANIPFTHNRPLEDLCVLISKK